MSNRNVLVLIVLVLIRGTSWYSFVHAWMACDGLAGELYSICRRVEELCNLGKRFAGGGSQQLADADVFPCVNERILADFYGSLANGADRADEASSLVQRRKNLRWFSRVESFFGALEAAVEAQSFFRSHAQGFHYAVPDEVWKAYTTDWYRMDSSYRSFCRAFDACLKTAYDLPADVVDGLEALAAWVERVYVNWFLADSNACWVAACENAWAQAGYVEGVPRQTRFYTDRIFLESGGAKKAMVIVSDALRYEVADELASRLESDTSGAAELDSMQGTFPTITEFGMAALLPHKTMQLREADGGIYLDGAPTASTEQRQAVLASAKPGAICIQSKRLVNAKQAKTGRLRVPRSGSFSRLVASRAPGEDAPPRTAGGPSPMETVGMFENACSVSMLRYSCARTSGLACNRRNGCVWKEVASMGVSEQRMDGYSDNDYFRMGAAIAVGELYDLAAFKEVLCDEGEVKSYLASFGVRGMADVDELGIKGPYRRDFERLYLGKCAED